MSPPWRDECCVTLAPTVAKWARWRHGIGRRPIEQEVLSVAQGAPGPAWRAPLAAWQAAWSDGTGGPERRSDVRVLLSNHFVRYAVVPWHDRLTGRDERQALAEQTFRSAYGDRVSAWQIRLAPTAHGQPALACAVDRELVETIGAVCRTGGHRLVALQPLLMTVFNQQRTGLRRNACLFVVEPGRLCCAWTRDGRWGAVRNVRLGAAPSEAPCGPERPAPGVGVDGQGQAGLGVIAALFERERQVLGVPSDVPPCVCDAGLGLPSSDPESPYDRLPPPKVGRGERPFALFAGAV